MAKDKDKGKKGGKDKSAKKAGKKGAAFGRTSPDFGVNALADHMGIEPATCRVKLREEGVKPEGGVYDFKSKDGVAKMAKKLGFEGKKKAA